MIWTIRIGDIIGLPKDPYHYEIVNFNNNKVTLLNQLEHTWKRYKINKLQKEAKILRRKD